MSTQRIYVPSHTEKTRQNFVLSLKLLANGATQQLVREVYKKSVIPAITHRLGRLPKQRREVEQALAQTIEFRQWATLTHRSQSMMWSAIEVTVLRVTSQANASLKGLRNSTTKKGSLQLNPALHIPPPIGNTEIHRQPGGFVGTAALDDLTPGLRYMGASMIYAVGKGQGPPGDGRADTLLAEVRSRFMDISTPLRILEIGCGIGLSSQAIARAFPQAEYHAIDVAAGLLRFGHLIAEERGVPIHFHQQDAAYTIFEAGSFDLIFSNILFHETNSARLPQILRECRRLLRPGGGMVHVDVANQTTRMALDDQVMNHWQVRWNGEPFWTGFAERDMLKEIIAAGFEPDKSFATHNAKPGGATYIFGARA